MSVSDVMWRTLYTAYRGTYRLSVGFKYTHACGQYQQIAGNKWGVLDPLEGAEKEVDNITEFLSTDDVTCSLLSMKHSSALNWVVLTFQVSTQLERNDMTLEEFKDSYKEFAADVEEQLRLESKGWAIQFMYTEEMFAEYLGDLCSEALCKHWGKTNPVPISFIWDAVENEYQLGTEEADIIDYVKSFSAFDNNLVEDFVSVIDTEPLLKRIEQFARECIEFATMWYKALGVNTVQEG